VIMTEPQPLRASMASVAEIFRRRGIDLGNLPPETTPTTGEGDWPAPDLLAETDRRIPPRYAGATATAPAIVDWVHQLRDLALPSGHVARTGPSLLVLGPTGVGKTHQAYGALRMLASCGVRGRWVAVPAADLYARLRPRHGVDSEAEFTKIADAPILVVDDLGAAKPSEWTEEINYRLVNHRYEHMLPTIFTSNVPARELGQVLGDRVASRLCEMAVRVVLEGADRRRAGGTVAVERAW